jgi:hypothetical protein
MPEDQFVGTAQMMPVCARQVKSGSAARKATRGEIPSGRPPEVRGTEARASTAWEHPDPKAVVAEPVARVVPVARGTPHEPEEVEVERAAPQHTECLL